MSADTLRDIATDTTVAAIANKVAYVGGGTAFLGGLSANEIAAMGGLIVAILGLLIQLVFKIRADARATELHHKRMSEDEEDGDEG